MLKRVSLVPISLLLISLLFAKDFWVELPYTEWTQNQAIRILTKSPWSSTLTVRIGNSSLLTGPSPAEPRSSCGTCPTEAESMPATLSDPDLLDVGGPRERVSQRKYFVRFRTATPVRMALARLAVLSGTKSQEQAQDYMENDEFPGQIVVVVEPASGEDVPELNHASFDALRENTYLHLKKSDQRIGLQQYVTPSQYGGRQAFFIFPRKKNEVELITLAEKEVRFVCQLSNEIKIVRKFKLEQMLFKGMLVI